MGAWIETSVLRESLKRLTVAPRVGAWIETTHGYFDAPDIKSLPVWERGLKLMLVKAPVTVSRSLPVWERGLKQAGGHNVFLTFSRSPCGSVD